MRENFQMRAARSCGEVALLSEEAQEAFLGFPISPSTRGLLCLAEN